MIFTFNSVIDILLQVWHIISEVKEEVNTSQHNTTVSVLQTLIKNILKQYNSVLHYEKKVIIF